MPSLHIVLVYFLRTSWSCIGWQVSLRTPDCVFVSVKLHYCMCTPPLRRDSLQNTWAHTMPTVGRLIRHGSRKPPTKANHAPVCTTSGGISIHDGGVGTGLVGPSRITSAAGKVISDISAKIYLPMNIKQIPKTELDIEPVRAHLPQLCFNFI